MNYVRGVRAVYMYRKRLEEIVSDAFYNCAVKNLFIYCTLLQMVY